MANTISNEAQVMLRMHDIHKSFGDLAVLKGIDVEVRCGEVLAIIGPSGSGKSTLLRCINKLETIDSGSIEIEGEFLADTDEHGAAEYADAAKTREILSHTGMVFQQFNLFPHMTVLENLIEAPIQVKGMKKAEILPYAKELLERRFKNRKLEIDESIMARIIKKMGYKENSDFYKDVAEEKID